MSTTFPTDGASFDPAPVHPARGMSPPPSRPSRRNPWADRLFGWAAKAAALVTLGLLAGILLSLLVGAWPAIEKYGLGFLTNCVWDPVAGEFGGLVMIYGTVATSLARIPAPPL